jgi:hypothetical protein
VPQAARTRVTARISAERMGATATCPPYAGANRIR